VKTDRWTELLETYQDDPETNQLIFVQYTGGSNADIIMYRKTGGVWKRILECFGYVGQNGIDKQKEGDRRTPTGTFLLTGAFGIQSDPGAKMSYVQVNQYLYWCGDPSYYNQLIDIREKPHTCSGEHLISYVPQYNYGMFVDYNPECVYKKGSAIFLHCTGSNTYTGGCIAVSRRNMIRIIRNAQEGARICIYPK
jgi:L,D-peptidoglycan transpeptidase YkuD (ErfK/YbiS/YcfS/YnhG family)